jgi:endonuclease YncB( thermonuclease family)
MQYDREMLRPIACLLLAFPLLSHAQDHCLVVGVTDGDTIKARCGASGAYEQVKVRIAAIDAPEKAQPYGQRSKEALSQLCFKQEAEIAPRNKDRYGRTVADVTCKGQDVARIMVAGGWAWVYDRYTEIGDAPLYKAQDVAQAARKGLWCDPTPVAPWEWRKTRRGAL